MFCAKICAGPGVLECSWHFAPCLDAYIAVAKSQTEDNETDAEYEKNVFENVFEKPNNTTKEHY